MVELWVGYIVLVLIGYITYKFYIYPLYISPTCKIPGPPVDHLFIGNIKNIIENEPGDMQYDWAQKYGGLVCYHSLFNEPILSITDPKLLQKILINNTYDFTKPSKRIVDIETVLGYGLVTVEGDVHRKQRKMMTPIFSFLNIKEMIPSFIHVAHQLKSIWMAKIRGGEEKIVIVRDLSKATLDIIGLVGFDYSFNSLTSSNEIATAYDQIFNSEPTSFNIAIKVISKFLPSVRKIPLPDNLKFHRAIKVVKEKSIQLVQEKKKLAAEGKLQGRDLMSLLVNINENTKEDAEKMSDLELQYQIMTLLAAGHETTSSCMTFALYLLAKNPCCQEKLRQELINAFPDPDFTATFDDFNRLEYLNCVIKEVLRIAPPIPLIGRSPKEDTVLNGYTIPKDTTLQIPISVIHRLPSVWGQDAEEFKPERWQLSSDAIPLGSGKTSDVNNLTYLPFISGPRSCIGNKMALSEVKTFLSILIRNFRFREVEGFKTKKVLSITLRSHPNIELWVSKVSE